MEKEKIYNNSILIKRLQIGSNVIKVISVPKESEDIVISNIISPETFPYLNTTYSDIISDCFIQLDELQKTVVVGQIERMMNDLSERQLQYIRSIDPSNYLEFFCEEEKDPEVLFSNIRGGEYIEMLLGKILLLEGLSKVMSKIDLEWGNLTPTGIDVVYIDLDKKILVLGENKFYKSLSGALKSVKKDIDKIVNGDKFTDELMNWKSKADRMPEQVSKWFIDELTHLDKRERADYIKENFKITVVGFVAGNSIEDQEIIDHFDSLFNDDLVPNYEIVIVAFPIDNKDLFIEKCLYEMHQLKEKYNG